MFPAYSTIIARLANLYYSDLPLSTRPKSADMSAGFLKDLRAYFGVPVIFDGWDRWFRANEFEYRSQIVEKANFKKVRKNPEDIFTISQVLLHEANGGASLRMPWSFMKAVSAIEIDSSVRASSLITRTVPNTLWIEFSGSAPEIPGMSWLRKCLGLLISRIVIFDEPHRISGFRAPNREYGDYMDEMLIALIDAASQSMSCVGYRLIVAMQQDIGIRFVPIIIGDDSNESMRSMLAGMYAVTKKDWRPTKDIEQVFANFGMRVILLAIVRKWFSTGTKKIELHAERLSGTELPPGMFSLFQNSVCLTHPPHREVRPFHIETTD